jgi:hypothetical protein
MPGALTREAHAAALGKAHSSFDLDKLKFLGEPFLLLGLFEEPCLRRWGACDRDKGAQTGCLTFVLIAKLRPVRQQAVQQLTQSVECIRGDPPQLVGLPGKALLLLYDERRRSSRSSDAMASVRRSSLLDRIAARRTARFNLNS